ncbi:putative MFS transporter YnfM [Erwinia amylovora MR1]|nr:putative MFS transporter YnfM [Erwinia amylovora MR1]
MFWHYFGWYGISAFITVLLLMALWVGARLHARKL